MRGELCRRLPNDVAACLHPVIKDSEASIANEILETHGCKLLVEIEEAGRIVRGRWRDGEVAMLK